MNAPKDPAVDRPAPETPRRRPPAPRKPSADAAKRTHVLRIGFEYFELPQKESVAVFNAMHSANRLEFALRSDEAEFVRRAPPSLEIKTLPDSRIIDPQKDQQP